MQTNTHAAVAAAAAFYYCRPPRHKPLHHGFLEAKTNTICYCLPLEIKYFLYSFIICSSFVVRLKTVCVLAHMKGFPICGGKIHFFFMDFLKSWSVFPDWIILEQLFKHDDGLHWNNAEIRYKVGRQVGYERKAYLWGKSSYTLGSHKSCVKKIIFKLLMSMNIFTQNADILLSF